VFFVVATVLAPLAPRSGRRPRSAPKRRAVSPGAAS